MLEVASAAWRSVYRFVERKIDCFVAALLAMTVNGIRYA